MDDLKYAELDFPGWPGDTTNIGAQLAIINRKCQQAIADARSWYDAQRVSAVEPLRLKLIADDYRDTIRNCLETARFETEKLF